MKRSVAVFLSLLLACCSLLTRVDFASATPAMLQGTAPPTCADSEEMAFLTLINNWRAQNGVGPLAFSQTLSVSSQAHNIDMITNNFFAHPGSDGSSWTDRTKAAGYPDPATTGENIFAGSDSAQSAFDWFKNDPPHNAVMLDPKYQAIGISRVNGPDSPWKWYWTTDFGATVDAAACTGDTGPLVIPGAAAPTAVPTEVLPPTPTATEALPPTPTTADAAAVPPTPTTESLTAPVPPTTAPAAVEQPTLTPTVVQAIVAPPAATATTAPGQPAANTTTGVVAVAACPTGEELAFIQAVNDYRAQNNLPALTVSAALSTAADAQAADMAAHDLRSDAGSDGSTIGARATAAGYTGGVGSMYSFGNQAGQATFDSLKGVASLNDIFLSPRYLTIGVARGDNATSPMKNYWMIVVGDAVDPSTCAVAAAAPAAPMATATTAAASTTTDTQAPTTDPAPPAANTAVDTDGDGLTDTDETTIYGTNPNAFDTDQGGVGDGQEVTNGTNPLDPADDNGAAQGVDPGVPDANADADGDGLTGADEAAFGTNPNLADSDGDGASDSDEFFNGTDPNDPNSV